MGIESEGATARIESVIAGLKSKEKWSEEDGQALLEVFEASGLRPTAFCRRFGLKPCRLWWRLGSRTRRDKKARQGSAVPISFAPVRLVENGLVAGSRPGAPGAGDNSMQVVLANGRRVVVGARFESSALARLVNALEGISC